MVHLMENPMNLVILLHQLKTRKHQMSIPDPFAFDSDTLENVGLFMRLHQGFFLPISTGRKHKKTLK